MTRRQIKATIRRSIATRRRAARCGNRDDELSVSGQLWPRHVDSVGARGAVVARWIQPPPNHKSDDKGPYEATITLVALLVLRRSQNVLVAVRAK